MKPVGSCRLCAVEVPGREKKRTIKLACVLKVRESMAIKTHGELVTQARAKAFQELVQMVPEARVLPQFADEWASNSVRLRTAASAVGSASEFARKWLPPEH